MDHPFYGTLTWTTLCNDAFHKSHHLLRCRAQSAGRIEGCLRGKEVIGLYMRMEGGEGELINERDVTVLWLATRVWVGLFMLRTCSAHLISLI
jgi:hypothetical protein